jgi:methyl-accepting chemotaxis protein
MKLSAKLVGSFSIMLILVLVLGLFSLKEMFDINKSTTELASNWLPSVLVVSKLNHTTSLFRRLEMIHALSTSEEDMQRYERQMENAVAELNKAMKIYEPLISEPIEREVYPQFVDTWNKYYSMHKTIIELSQKKETEKATKLISGESAKLIQHAQGLLDKLVEVNEKGSQKSASDSLEAYILSRNTVLVILVVATLLGLGLAALLIKNVLGQLGEDPGYLLRVANEIAGGNLDLRFKPVRGHGGVYAVLIKMVQTLKEKIADASAKSEDAARQAEEARKATALAEEATNMAERAKAEGMLQAANKLESVVERVTSASEQLSAQIEQSSRGAENQAQRVSETATAMEEMNATVLEVAKNASQASEVSVDAKHKAEDGAKIVNEVVAFIGQIKNNSEQSLDDMNALGKQAESIGQILNVISDIADQTNLLALNAAIEAARAGEAGRGFAVVADEVRKLAEKTMVATKDVGGAIRGIQESAKKNIVNVQGAVRAIGDMTALAGKSGEALNEIVNLVDTASDQVNSIATASEEQSAASEEINRSIEEVSTISSETSQAMGQAAQAVSELAAQAQVLSALVVELKNEGRGARR